jgi:glycine/D-amino acid oxidase-like deaminating enzyme
MIPAGRSIAAYHKDEMDVLREFVDKEHNLRPIKLLNKEKSIQSSPALNPSGLIGTLSSQSEVIVDPRQAIAAMPSYLNHKYGVTFHFHKAVTRIEHPRVYAGDEIYEGDQIFVCSGADFETLYPEVFVQNAVTKCKLQMMRTVPQPESWRAGPSLFAGLTLPHYDSFRSCASLSVLKETLRCRNAGVYQMGDTRAHLSDRGRRGDHRRLS